MIFGIGTDIVEIKRIETMTSLDKFASKILSHNEKEFYDSLISFGEKSLNIQRYKGLGEMNPEQLWETTLDPTLRVLREVTIADIEDIDKDSKESNLFEDLMGDQVEPRKKIIEDIEKKTGKTESEVIKIMRRSLKPSSFRLWRKRVNSQSIKHRKKFEYSRKLIRSKIKKEEYLD